MTQQPCTSPVIEGLPPENSPVAVLVDVRTGNHPDEGFDRVVFDFRDDTSMPGFSVSYVEQIVEDPRGTPLEMLPGAMLLVDMRWAAAHEDGQLTVPLGDLDLRPGLPRIKQVKRAGDFEGVLTFGIAVDPAGDPAPFHAYVLSGNRLVIDVAHAGQSPWYCGQVYFGDQQKITAGIDPVVTAVERRLAKPPAAGAALQALFKGPSAAERERGLVFVDSHATGFADLRVSQWKVAHVRLLGPISSDGSAVITIATQIIPTLKQFATVDWVKIYDEDGKTEQPDGPVDSIPSQLEP
jgi:Sporulation and spore germination